MSDWLTQRWVRATGRKVSLADQPWLDGPVGGTHQIGPRFFDDYAALAKLELLRDGVRGLIPDFRSLEAETQSLAAVAPAVKDFYEATSTYDLDAWSEWHGLFRFFGKGLSLIFSTRLQQLNVPLSALDSAKGMTSSVVQMREIASQRIVQTAWVRQLHATNNVLYAGSYSVCTVPGWPHPCVKVVFPLPNGNAIVLMKVRAYQDGSLALQSMGKTFGQPGFYFVVHEKTGRATARYVRSLKEEIRVYAAENNSVRADHKLWFCGVEFLRLHYRMRRPQPHTSTMRGSAWQTPTAIQAEKP
ncbi:MAG: hypothetical protein WBX22_25515 [Silvibacterium sp.]